MVHAILDRHQGNLTSSRFKHFSQNLALGELEGWIEHVKEKNKRLDSLTLECFKSILDPNNQDLKPNFLPEVFSTFFSLDLTNYVLEHSTIYAFGESLKTLKLKKMDLQSETINGILKKCLGLEKFSLVQSTGFNVLEIKNPNLKFLELKWLTVEEINVYIEGLQAVVLDSLICPEKGLKMYSQNLNTFYSSYDPIVQIIYLRKKNLKTHEILENCSDLFVSSPPFIFILVINCD